MDKIATFIKRLIRRVKRMGEFWSTTGVLLIPLGFWLMVQLPEAKWVGAIAGSFGVFCWFKAYWMIRARERLEREEKAQLLTLNSLGTIESHRKLDAVIEELKRLNQNKATND